MPKIERKVVNTRNRMLSQNVYMTLNTKHTDLNNNILIIGGSGCGKSFRFAKPNLMQMSSSFIVTDPKGELCRDTAGFLKSNGYSVKVLNLEDFKKSTRYNPFVYLKTDTDVIKLIGNLIKNTTPKGASPNDPFWEKAEGMLLQSIFQYVWREGVLNEETGKKEHNIRAVLRLLNEADFKENPKTGAKMDSLLDKRMEALENEQPHHPAVLKYNKVMRGAADTVRSIIISANSRLAPIENEEILDLMCSDEIDIDSIGTRKTVVYCIIPDSDDTYNFLVGLLYTQMFQRLYYIADHIYGGSLPVHVTFLLDEFANVALPDGYCSLLSTMRSRSISSIIIIQNMAQIKALFEKTYETIQGNCDTLIFLGSNEQQTQKYISEMMGKQTIYKVSSGLTRGKNGSSSSNEDVLGREVMLPDEIRRLKRDECLILVNGYNPVKDKKIDTVNHPLFEELVKCSKSYTFDARLERNYRGTAESDEEIKILSAVDLEHMRALDQKDYEEYKKEAYVCSKTGKEQPEKPKRRVIEIDFEDLIAIDFEKLESEINEGTDLSSLLSEAEMKANLIREQELESRRKQEEYETTINVRKELHTPEEARLYLRLKREGYSVPSIRAILRLIRESNAYTEDIVVSYFSPDMEIDEIEECIEVLLEE